jgi:7-cyano-7-deazaguanine synthase
MKKAVVLLSGGLDSATCLAVAKAQGFTTYALSFAYGQRQQAELQAAANIAQQLGAAEHRIIALDLGQIGGSALTDHAIAVPETAPSATEIPVTYVPARNTVFLSIALGWAEVLAAQDIFIGVSAVDYSNYPDCRPEYIAAFQQMANLATKAGVNGQPIQLHTPLIHLTKAATIQLGMQHGVDYSLTVTCYQPDAVGRACGRCHSCQLRQKGFTQANIADPTRYQTVLHNSKAEN